jgi:hypothetical protein
LLWFKVNEQLHRQQPLAQGSPSRVPVIPSPRQGGMELCGRSRAGSIGDMGGMGAYLEVWKQSGPELVSLAGERVTIGKAACNDLALPPTARCLACMRCSSTTLPAGASATSAHATALPAALVVTEAAKLRRRRYQTVTGRGWRWLRSRWSLVTSKQPCSTAVA